MVLVIGGDSKTGSALLGRSRQRVRPVGGLVRAGENRPAARVEAVTGGLSRLGLWLTRLCECIPESMIPTIDERESLCDDGFVGLSCDYRSLCTGGAGVSGGFERAVAQDGVVAEDYR